MRWDIFCKVIDNLGDAGVCWRLAADLAARGDAVRLWIDDPRPLAWMAPRGHPGVTVLPWEEAAKAEPADAVVEAFGCDPEPSFVAAMAAAARGARGQPAWINLEYLSAEPWVERFHGLPSPVLSGPGTGLAKRFFYPGFTPRTGGLLREPDLLERQARFDRDAWLLRQGIHRQGERVVSLFCYEPPGLPGLFQWLAGDPRPTHLLVTPGRAEAAVRALPAQSLRGERLRVHFLAALPQPGFDELLWSCDLNFVRGEDSLVRALWAGRPLVWNPYPQEAGAHLPKLHAFLDWLEAPPALRAWHDAWNVSGRACPPPALDAWQDCTRAARERLLALPDLAGSLRRFAALHGPAGSTAGSPADPT